MGETPITLGFHENGVVSSVAGDPMLPLVAVGFEDGLVLIAELDENSTTERAVMIKPQVTVQYRAWFLRRMARLK